MIFSSVLLNVLPLCFLLCVIVVSFVRRNSRAALQLVLCASIAFLWSLGSFIEPLVPTFGAKFFWRNATQIGTFYLPVSVISFSLAYVNSPKRWRLLAIYILYAIQTLPIALILTDNFHHLMRSSVSLVTTRSGFQIIGVEQTMLGKLFVSLNYVYSFVGVAILILYAQDKNRAAKQQALTAASFIALPTIFAALKNALGDASFEGIPASFAFAVGCLVILYSIRRIGFLGLKAIARDRAFDVIDEGIIVSDDEWRPVDINSSARRILSNCFGLDNNANVDMIASRLSEKIKPNLASLYAGNELRFELPRSGSEHSLYFALRVFPLIDHAATVGYAGVIRDVTSDTLKMSDLRQLAERDPLTAIYNKSAFREIVSGLRALSPATGCLIIFDIDNFKDYNDRWGHLAGDSVLKDVCSYCRESLRDGDVFGRVGGDEFAVFLSNVTDDDAQALAARIKAKIAANGFTTGSNSLRVTISMGVAHSASQDESFEDLFSRADQALYRSKKEGRNRITLADRKPSPCV